MSLERSPCGADVAAAKCPPDVRKERQAGRNGGRAGAAGDPSPLKPDRDHQLIRGIVKGGGQ